MSETLDARGTLLQGAAFEAARTWANACRADLTREGRRIEGGWPGTVREARTRAATEAAKVLVKESMTALTHDELDRLSRITYDEARRFWSVAMSRRPTRKQVRT